MERFTARKPQSANNNAVAAKSTNESFSEMANVTATKSGVVGKLLVVSLIIVSIAITAFVGYAIVRGVGEGNLVDSSKYQAVFLSDGQIYFGKLTNVGDKYATLENIYYLQVQQAVQPDAKADPQQQVSLAKLGNELHGPEDKMQINVDHVLFWENLKDDGQVVTAINKYVSGDKQTPAASTPASNNSTPAATTPVTTPAQ